MKILILQNRMGIGDMIMFLPFIEAISKKFKTPVTILAKKNTKIEMYFNNKEIVEEIMYLEREENKKHSGVCLLYTSPSPRDRYISRMPSSA